MNVNTSGGVSLTNGSRAFETAWRGILDVLPAAAYTCDAAGLITYFNRFAERVWGRAPLLRDGRERYCGSHRLYLSDGTPMRHDQCWMALALQEEKVYDGREIIIERPDGSRTVGEAYVYPLHNRQRKLVGAVNVVADITALKDPRAVVAQPEHADIPHAALLTMIGVVMSVLPAARLECV
jgi:PAS domain S-box-containing protein